MVATRPSVSSNNYVARIYIERRVENIRIIIGL